MNEKRFDTGSVKLNYLDYGSQSDEPMILLHGGAWCWQEFLSLIPGLSDGRRIYAPDLRGNGKSEWREGHYRLEDFTGDLLEFMKMLDSPAILAGHSIGGVIALMAAARSADKVKAVIVEDAPLTLQNYRNVIESSREMFNVWLELKKSSGSEQDLALALAEKYRNYPGVTSAWILFFAKCLWLLDPAFFDALLNDFDGFTRGYDYRFIMAGMTCPVLFIRGEAELGAVMTDEEISWLQKNCGTVRYEQISGVGHLLHLQDEGQTPVLEAMKAFLRSVQM